MKNIHLIVKLLSYKFLRLYNKPPYPISVTLSVTNKCNSRCKTCKVWQQRQKKDLPLKEWERILTSLGESPYFITISGGEPFLNDDLVEIIRLISKNNKPEMLNIASNGILTDKILDSMTKVLGFYKGKITVNLSLDGKKNIHNRIRGIDCFDKVLDTFYALKTLEGVSVGIHSVISKYSADDFITFHKFVKHHLKPSQHIIEIAENRAELNNLNDKIIPKNDDYLKIIDSFQVESTPFSFKMFLRRKYYNLTRKMIMKHKGIRCYAGLAFAHVSSDGKLWACCMKCESLGDLKKNDFKQIWSGRKALNVRGNIRKRKCFCNLANANLINLALNWWKLCAL